MNKLQRYFAHAHIKGDAYCEEIELIEDDDPSEETDTYKSVCKSKDVEKLEAENAALRERVEKLQRDVCELEAMIGFGGGDKHKVAFDRGWKDGCKYHDICYSCPDALTSKCVAAKQEQGELR